MVLPDTGTDGGLPRPASRCDHRDRARAPRGTGRTARPGTGRRRPSRRPRRPAPAAAGSIFRRFVGGERPARTDAQPESSSGDRSGPDATPTPAARRSSPSRSTRSSGSPGGWPPRTTARTLVRMIVDETKRGAPGRRVDHPPAPRRPPRGRRLGRSGRRRRRDACRSSGATRAGSARSCGAGHVMAWPDIRADRPRTATTGTPESSTSPATSSPR